MQELITPAALANRVRQRRETYQGSLLIVEGASDAKFYGQLIDKACCQLLPPAQNRDKAIKVLEILQEAPGVIAIVDKDFDELNGTLPDVPNLFFTDTHDLETMLLKSPALEKLLWQLGSEVKLAKFGRDVRDALLDAGCTIGYLLWVSLQDSLHLKFEGIAFPKFIDELTLAIDETKLIEEVKRKSQKLNLKTTDLQQRLAAQKSPDHDIWQICRGHDLINILSVGLRKAIGTKHITVETLEGNLQMCYERVDFQTTQLYVEIDKWQIDHPTYRILKTT